MFVKPKPGLKVRNPETKALLPADGAEVPTSLYWTRRVRDGDVVVSTAPTAAPVVTAAQEPLK